MPMSFSEEHTFGDNTRKNLLRSDHKDDRDWLSKVPECPSLTKFQVNHLGEIFAEYPYSVVREHQDGTFFLSTFEGEGEILINGEWVRIGEKQACLMPPFRLNALRAISGVEWKFHYVRYYQDAAQRTPITCKEPVITNFDSQVFASAMKGLLNERSNNDRPKFLTQWMRLIQVYVEDFSEQWKVDDRLWDLWHVVARNLEHDWTLDSMAKQAFVSTEHLRRLTIATYGRSPIKHLTWLRMHRAAELLISTDNKVEVIGFEVGYSSPYVFSTAFKRFFNTTPTQYRNSKKLDE